MYFCKALLRHYMIFSTKKEKKYTFVEAGEGHPLVLLHGLMGGLSNFDKMVDFFSERGFKVYMYLSCRSMICRYSIRILPRLQNILSSLLRAIFQDLLLL